MFFLLILIKRCLYNQGYVAKDFFLLKPSKSVVVTFVKNFSNHTAYNLNLQGSSGRDGCCVRAAQISKSDLCTYL